MPTDILTAEQRMFPIQSQRDAAPHPLSIPWSIAELAYSVYSANYGRGQSLERLAERGGFGPNEMDTFLPGWRNKCSEIEALRAERDELKRRINHPNRCEGCWCAGDQVVELVHVPNGAIRLCLWCLEAINQKNPELAVLRSQASAGAKFKEFVHSYLDQHGVPHGDPDNEHQKQGCRIGARLDLLFERIEDWRAWVATIIGFDHIATTKTDRIMREDVKEEIQRLIDRVGEVQAEHDELEGLLTGPHVDHVAALERDNTALVQALRPFADHGKFLNQDVAIQIPDDEPVQPEKGHGPTIGDCRRAAALLAKSGGEE